MIHSVREETGNSFSTIKLTCLAEHEELAYILVHRLNPSNSYHHRVSAETVGLTGKPRLARDQ